jgi:hypothetical protein
VTVCYLGTFGDAFEFIVDRRALLLDFDRVMLEPATGTVTAFPISDHLIEGRATASAGAVQSAAKP